MKMSFTLILALFVCALPLCAQDQSPEIDDESLYERFGVAAHVGPNIHTAGFTALPGSPSCCPEYRWGFGLGPSVDLLYERPIASNLLFSVRGGISLGNATLARDETTTVESDGEARELTIEHRLDAALFDIGITPLISYAMPGGLNLMGGTRLSYLSNATFDQREQIGSDNLTGTFENGRRERNEFDGDIPGARSILASLVLGAGYELPMNNEGSLLLTPEVMVSAGVIPLSGEVSWNNHSVRGGIALKYSPIPSPEAPMLPPDKPTAPPGPTPPEIVASIDAVGVSRDGTETPNLTLRVEEFTATDSRPLLNYVFFEQGESKLPPRYEQMSKDAVDTYNPSNLYRTRDLTEHQHVLNIIGYRMHRNPGQSIRIVGTNSNAGVEAGNVELSRKRAHTVRDYLNRIWGISNDRMTVEARNLPATPSNPQIADGRAENRRVEIHADNPELLSPLVLRDTIRHVMPPTVRFRPDVSGGANVDRWTIQVRQQGALLKTISGKGPVPNEVDWKIDADDEAIPAVDGPISYSLSVSGSSGQSTSTPVASMDVEQRTIRQKLREGSGSAQIERFGLILFNFDQANLTADHRRIIKEVAGRIDSKADVTVTGYTDRTGDLAHNRELAAARAQRVADALGIEASRVHVTSTVEPPFDNALPEGRFYSRFVEIEVRNPVEASSDEVIR